MKGSVVTSLVLHVLLLVWLTVTFGSPEPMSVSSEAMPVELVPVEDLAQLQQGDKTAPKKEQSALQETKNQDQVANAQNTGENNFDLDTVPTPTEKPSNVQKAGAPEKADKVVEETKTGDSQSPDEPQVQPTEELAAVAQPKVDVTPVPRPDPQPTEEKAAEQTSSELPVPDAVPVPSLRPEITQEKKEEKKDEKKAEEKPKKTEEKKTETEKKTAAEAKTAKTQERKKDEKKGKSQKAATTKDSDFNTDQIASLLNKTEDQSGGAKRSTKSRAFGADKSTGGQKLSQDELNALKGIIEDNWSIQPGQVTSNDIVITVKFELDENGDVVGRPEVDGSGGEESTRRALESGAVRAVMRSAPFDKLPKDKFETWRYVTVNFRPSELL